MYLGNNLCLSLFFSTFIQNAKLFDFIRFFSELKKKLFEKVSKEP